METTTKLEQIKLDDIELSETNRMFRDEADFTEAALKDLAESINKAGVISPILVRPGKKKKYELVCGERRFHASKMVMAIIKNRNTIPANIRELTDDQALEAQVIENLQRENVNPMKEAIAFDWMTKTKKMAASQIADRIGKSADYVQERIRLTMLDKTAQELVRTGVLPLKAALKITRIPQHLHKDALDECIETIHGAKGPQKVFSGLSNLQDWIEYNVSNDLAKANFDTSDLKLIPAAGGCAACPKRTKNTGGLFDDITKGDLCLDGGCFRAKQIATYKQLAAELKAKHPNVEIVYRARSYNDITDEIKKQFQPVWNHYIGNEISEAEAKKDAKAKLAIFIGPFTNESKKRFGWVTMKDPVQQQKSQSSLSPKQKEQLQKNKIEAIKQNRLRNYETQLTGEAIVKKANTQLNPEFMKQLILENFDQGGDYNEALVFFKATGIDWLMTKSEGKKMTKVKVVAKSADIQSLIDDATLEFEGEDLESSLKKLSGNQLNAMLVWSFYCNGYPYTNIVSDLFKPDKKAINSKAKVLMAAWWKEEQAKKKVDTNKKVKTPA